MLHDKFILHHSGQAVLPWWSEINTKHLLPVHDFLGLLTPLGIDYVTRPFSCLQKGWQLETSLDPFSIPKEKWKKRSGLTRLY